MQLSPPVAVTSPIAKSVVASLEVRIRTTAAVPVVAPLTTVVEVIGMVGAGVSFGRIGGLSGLVVVSSFVGMLVFHELGHFVAARLSGMQVTEFFIGFGPRLWSVRRGETTYGVKAIPAGAYVRITGMSSLDVVDPAVEYRTYRRQSYPRRMAVALAGSATQFAVALALLFVVYVAVGRPDPTRWVVGEVVSGSAAAAADVHVGDRIVSVAGVAPPGVEEFGRVGRGLPGQAVVVVTEREGDRSKRTMVLGERLMVDGTVAGFFGVGPDRPMETLGPVDAAAEASARFVDLVGLSVDGLVGFFTRMGWPRSSRAGSDPRRHHPVTCPRADPGWVRSSRPARIRPMTSACSRSTGRPAWEAPCSTTAGRPTCGS